MLVPVGSLESVCEVLKSISGAVSLSEVAKSVGGVVVSTEKVCWWCRYWVT